MANKAVVYVQHDDWAETGEGALAYEFSEEFDSSYDVVFAEGSSTFSLTDRDKVVAILPYNVFRGVYFTEEDPEYFEEPEIPEPDEDYEDDDEFDLSDLEVGDRVADLVKQLFNR